MAENLIRGGISSVFEKRLVSANKKFVKTYDRKQPSVFLFQVTNAGFAKRIFLKLTRKY